MTQITKLEWDSDFFGLTIGEVNLQPEEILKKVPNRFDLIYVKQNIESELFIKNFNLNFSETKIIFSKKIFKRDNFIVHKEIKSANEKNVEIETIYNLAYESGKWSRFNLDTKFSRTQFENLYKTWVENSLLKKNADNILLFIVEKKTVGFITYKINKNLATIGLVAVDFNFQGNGIGSKLLDAVENLLALNNIQELIIPTQLQNIQACKFYTKLGFKIKNQYIFKHYWKGK